MTQSNTPAGMQVLGAITRDYAQIVGSDALAFLAKYLA